MQPQESFSIQRRALDLEDFIDIARRHKSWIFGPAFLALVATVVGVFLWPNTYVSSASLKVVPQQMPENLVQSNINQQMQDRITSMVATVRSRQVLTQIINTLGLYPREKTHMPLDDIIEKMNKDFVLNNVQTLGSGTGHPAAAFQISFFYDNRIIAQRVATELVTRFMDMNVRERSAVAVNTTTFLRDQWEGAKKNLDDLEQRLFEFRAKNQGRLPEQAQAAYQQLGVIQQQIGNVNNQLSRVNNEKLLLESELQIHKDKINHLKEPATVTAAAQVVKNERVAQLDRDIEQAEIRIAQYREQYKDTHPDMKFAQSQLALLKKRREEALKEDTTKKPDTVEVQTAAISPLTAREIQDEEGAIRRIQSQIETRDLDTQNLNKELTRLNDAQKVYQSRLEGVPLSEKQYVELMRDRDLAKAKYEELDLKRSKSEMAEQMEDRKQGENLEILDSANTPIDPVSPKRPQVIAIGTGIGLLLGVVLAGIREMKDTSLKNLKDVRAYTQLAILGSVPLLENDLVVRRRRRIAWLVWSSACLLGMAIMTGSIVYYVTVTKA